MTVFTECIDTFRGAFPSLCRGNPQISLERHELKVGSIKHVVTVWDRSKFERHSIAIMGNPVHRSMGDASKAISAYKAEVCSSCPLSDYCKQRNEIVFKGSLMNFLGLYANMFFHGLAIRFLGEKIYENKTDYRWRAGLFVKVFADKSWEVPNCVGPIGKQYLNRMNISLFN